jgi:hypothetical protein
MVMFALAFSLIGVGVNQSSNLYLQYFDKTEYYRVIPPIKTDKSTYVPCEKVEVYITREALFDTQGKSIISLTLISENPIIQKRIQTITRDVVVTKGIDTYVASWPLPCDVKPGTYYWEINFRYYIRNITKTAHFATDKFQIINKL